MADLDPVIANILLAWLTFFGASIGSFLNVVVYRLPLGKSLSDPPSHCPKCGHPIRWFDNVPVLGWLWLGGRCRDCKEPISVRYPIVEFVGGAVFGLITWLTIRRGGDASLAEFFFFVLGMSSLVLTFFAAGLIERDGKPVPWRLFLPVLVMGPMMPWLVQEGFHLPWLHHAKLGGVLPLTGPWMLATIFYGGVISVISFINDTTDGLVRVRHFLVIATGLLTGVYLGSYAMIAIFIASIFVVFIRLTPWRDAVNFYLLLSLAVFVRTILMLYFAPASAPLG